MDITVCIIHKVSPHVHEKGRKLLKLKKINISIYLSFFTVLAAPLDQTRFSPLQTQIWHQDGLYPLSWKSITTLHLFIIIHTYRSNTKLENTLALLHLPWKEQIEACWTLSVNGTGLSTASLQLLLKHRNCGGRMWRLLSSTEQHRVVSPAWIWNCWGHLSWQNSITQLEPCQQGSHAALEKWATKALITTSGKDLIFHLIWNMPGSTADWASYKMPSTNQHCLLLHWIALDVSC